MSERRGIRVLSTLAVVALASIGLIAIPAGCRTKSAQVAPKVVQKWTCVMHPQVVSDKPGKCPICGMDLVPKLPAATERTGAGSAAAPAAATVALSAETIQATGVTTAPVQKSRLLHEIRAVGEIAADETRLERVAARVAGRVERLHANFTGQPVRRGAPLYSLYSPDLVATQREYLLAVENRRRLQGASDEALRSADALVEAARDRLRLWGISGDQIRGLERTRRPELALTFHSPVSGVVLQKSVVEGQYVAEGTELYLLGDLSSVWLVASIYEADIGRIRKGQSVIATVPAYPGRQFEGRVVFIEPVLDPETRTTRVRAVVPNPAGELKPGMFADARLAVDLGEALSIPKSAAIDTGARQLVYVETSPGSFTARPVKLGATAGDRREVIEGLREGERVVASANFFIDSQAQLASGSSIQWSGALEVKTTPTPEGARP